MKAPRCLLLHFWADIDSNPMVMGLIRGLTSHGLSLDLIMESRDFLLPPSLPPGVRVHVVESWRKSHCEVGRILSERGPFDLFVAVDMQALFALDPFLDRIHAPMAYVSLELTFSDEIRRFGGPEDARLKLIEGEAGRRARLVIIQDSVRARLLAEENGMDPRRFVFLPNAPADPGIPCRNSDRLRERFGISENRRILLHTGSFDTWTAGEELLAAAAHLPDDWVLIIHSRQRPVAGSYLARKLAEVDHESVVFSTEPLPFDRYPELVASCDAVLVLYKPGENVYLGRNLRHIGLSSGKFSYACCAGKPVVANDVGEYRSIFQEHGCGMIWENPEDPRGLGRLLADNVSRLAAMGRAARTFFLDHLDFGRNLPPVLDRMTSLLIEGSEDVSGSFGPEEKTLNGSTAL